ncbi:flagellar hook-associated family protein [Oryzifoliimicrobium ureilyticus]|uniref:flagellar hook-associated family protein n=1 Tax=Oryzifoliimicrobium ureilyticus TaxID=3113724 RepID=UPI003075F143
MKSSFVSSAAIQNAMRLTMRQTQNQIVKTSLEATTGTYADIGESLGNGVSKVVDFNRELDRIKAITDSNSVAGGRLSTIQDGLSDLQKTGTDFASNLTALQGSQNSTSIKVAIQSANNTLNTLLTTGNGMYNGEYIFGGINSDTQPLTDQSSTVASNISTALTTYAGSLGVAVQDMTGDQMTDFITTQVEPMFSEANWTDPTNGWSKASDQPMTSRISNSEVVATSTSANSDGMRYVALSAVMTSALLSTGNLSADAMNAVSKKAIAYAAQGTSGLVSQSSQLGLSQERVEKANDSLNAQSTLIQTKLTDLTGVDQTQASTMLKSLQTQLETSYTIVSKIQQLSLVNYL